MCYCAIDILAPTTADQRVAVVGFPDVAYGSRARQRRRPVATNCVEHNSTKIGSKDAVPLIVWPSHSTTPLQMQLCSGSMTHWLLGDVTVEAATNSKFLLHKATSLVLCTSQLERLRCGGLASSRGGLASPIRSAALSTCSRRWGALGLSRAGGTLDGQLRSRHRGQGSACLAASARRTVTTIAGVDSILDAIAIAVTKPLVSKPDAGAARLLALDLRTLLSTRRRLNPSALMLILRDRARRWSCRERWRRCA
mmetsp:Transcript_23399/g.54424  ORF Transcript_23399/g.54424 Transcript_23399/m.54424 type:complete len:253 (+) Transcript_23399:1383-2141(+)